MNALTMTAGLLITAFAAIASANEMPYMDDQFGCIDRATADRYIRDFGIDTRSFGGLELCRAQVDTKKLLNDLQIVEQGRFGTQGNNTLIRGFVPASNYYPWLKSQTRGMNRGNDVPYATAYNRMGYFTMQDGWAKMSTLGRVGTVVHEARHTAGYRHYPCNQGPYAGARLDGCDQNYQAGGSHGVEMEYYARVSVQGTNFHPVYKSMARLMAMARSNFVFNQPVMQAREALLVMGTDGVPTLFDRAQRYTREAPAVAAPHALKRTSFGAVLFDGLNALSIELYEVTSFRPVLEDSYSYFKLLERDHTPVRDLEELDVGSKRYLVKITTDNKIATFNFPSGDWNSSRAIPTSARRLATVAESGQKGLFVVASDDRILPFDPATQQFGAALAFPWQPQFVNFASWGQRTYGVTRDGKVWIREAQQWSPWSEAADLVAADLVAVPLYDAFQVVP